MNEDKKISLDDYLEKAIPHLASLQGEGKEEDKKEEKTIYYIT